MRSSVMFRRSFFILSAVLCGGNAIAGGALKYSATDANGTIERIVEMRALVTGHTGAMVSYSRKDGSRSFVEYALDCEQPAFAYLGMTEDDGNATPNLLTVRNASDRMLSNEVRPVELIALGDNTDEVGISAIAQAVCS